LFTLPFPGSLEHIRIAEENILNLRPQSRSMFRGDANHEYQGLQINLHEWRLEGNGEGITLLQRQHLSLFEGVCCGNQSLPS